jgi:hypothetical protein
MKLNMRPEDVFWRDEAVVCNICPVCDRTICLLALLLAKQKKPKEKVR